MIFRNRIILALIFVLTGTAKAQFAGLPDDKVYPIEDKDYAELVVWDGDNILTSLGNDTGYMASGMGDSVKLANVTNPFLSTLYQKNVLVRSQNNAPLPITFQNLINFTFGYIKANSTADSATENGVAHEHLSLEIARASFCFGTDPLMTLSKIRRETSFSRMGISSGGAVGFSQMTGAGINEVQQQMSGDLTVSAPGVREFFRMAIRCYTGNADYNSFKGDRITTQTALRNDYRLDLIYGQILLKTYVSYAKSASKRGLTQADSLSSYRDAFILYNGDSHVVKGQCLKGRVQMKYEYSCDILQFYNNLNNQWNNYLARIPKINFT